VIQLLLLLAALLSPLALRAQLQLYDAPPGTTEETPVPSLHQHGSTGAGGVVSRRYRLRNIGALTVTLTRIRISGTGFSMTGQPSPPHLVTPGNNVDFTVHFKPLEPGSFTGHLEINTASYILQATAGAAAVLYGPDGAIGSGSTIDLGRTERGNVTSASFEIRNTTAATVPISGPGVTGAAFSLEEGPPAPPSLGPGERFAFAVRFTPAGAGVFRGTLTANNVVVQLTGSGFEPQMPRPFITLDRTLLRSNDQVRVRVSFNEPSRAIASGQLRLELTPVTGVRDADNGLKFLPNGGRSVPVSVERDAAAASVNGGADVVFQTGTTAGTLAVVLELGGWTERHTVTIAPETVRIDSTRLSSAGGALDVQVNGYDNTRSVDKLSFTFYAANGQPIGAPMDVDAASSFANWFSGSSLGGIFGLRARFPVTGDVRGIASAEVKLTNSLGVSSTERLTF
jgi:hypothetical protein